MSSIFDRLTEYGKTNAYPFHMPGHKRNLKGDLLNDITQIDITEIDGFDNLHDAKGLIAEAQERASKLYGAEESFFLVNGSTCGILSAVAACVPEGGWLMMGRNCHKSVYHAALLGRLNTTYLYPKVKKGYSFYEGFGAEEIKQQVEEFYRAHPKEKLGAVLITSPTYEGIISDVQEISDFLHEKGIPLIVDEAHGAHLGLSGQIPNGSCSMGADLVIHSVHKTLPAMTQTAILHVNGQMVDRDRLKRYLRIYQTSSPSYVLMASIDRAVTEMTESGEEYFRKFSCRKTRLISELQDLKRIRIYRGDDLDPCKLVLSTKDSPWTGKTLYDKLREEYNLQMEMAAGDYLVAILTVLDTDEGFERLARAIKELDLQLDEEMNSEAKHLVIQEETAICYPKVEKYTIARALDLPQTKIFLAYARNRICADFVYVYPPGIPILVPGERIEEEHITYFERIQKQGLDLKGINDNQITVLEEQ